MDANTLAMLNAAVQGSYGTSGYAAAPAASPGLSSLYSVDPTTGAATLNTSAYAALGLAGGIPGLSYQTAQVAGVGGAYGVQAGYGQQAAFGQTGFAGFGDGGGLLGTQREFFGEVITFHEDRGWGHIRCEEVRASFQKDVFVLRSALRCGKVAPGDKVKFKLQETSKGPQAADVYTWDGSGAMATSAPTPSFGLQGAPAANVIQETQNRAFIGRIKLFNEEKGWGFVDCAETFKLFGKDMFVHKREFDDPAIGEGSNIQFYIELGRDGRPEARRVSWAPAGQPAAGQVPGILGGLSAGGFGQLSPDMGSLLGGTSFIGTAPAPGVEVTAAAGASEVPATSAAEGLPAEGYGAAPTEAAAERSSPY